MDTASIHFEHGGVKLDESRFLDQVRLPWLRSESRSGMKIHDNGHAARIDEHSALEEPLPVLTVL